MPIDPDASHDPTPAPGAAARRDAWSGYWQAGSAHSCPGSFGQAYGGAIERFWRQAIECMGRGERVLEVGTGNGPLPRQVADQLGGNCPGIDAVDIAAIRPGWWSVTSHPQIRFHAGVSAEDLPFDADSFDWLVSQYGFEYGDRDGSLNECRRVLRPDGRVAMVLHHRDSVVCRVGQAELGHYRHLLSDQGVLSVAAQVIPYLHEAAARGAVAIAGNAGAKAARMAYNSAMTDLGQRIGQMPHPDALVEARQRVHALVCDAASRPVQASMDALRNLGAQLSGAATRLDDLLEHALDERQVDAVARALASSGDNGKDIRYEPLRQKEGILGWALRIG